MKCRLMEKEDISKVLRSLDKYLYWEGIMSFLKCYVLLIFRELG